MKVSTTITAFFWMLVSCWFASADEAVGPGRDKLKDSQVRAIGFLKSSQLDDGAWTDSKSVGITGLVTYSLLRSGVAPQDPTISKALQKLKSLANPDGSVCAADSRIPAYETAIALMTFQAANETGVYTDIIRNAEGFVRGVQFDEGESIDASDDRYGGAGYSPKGGRPDLSNTTFFLEALQAAGTKPDDPAVQKAMLFVSRCQNLESEANPNGGKLNDGGFFYSVSSGGESPAGRAEENGPRSYGSMTYAGLKSLLYAGVKNDDPRVKAAVQWIEKNYTVTSNPGMGDNGLFYYYYLFAKSLDSLNRDYVIAPDGSRHDWRKELAEELFQSQTRNGSWVNSKSNRWMEGDPNLVTAYSLVALNFCSSKKSR